MTLASISGTSAQLTLLDQRASTLRVEIDEVCAVQLHLRLSKEVPFAAPVKIESPEMLLLGDVTHCVPSESGFTAGVTVRHYLALHSLFNLSRALKSFGNGPTIPAPVEHPAFIFQSGPHEQVLYKE